MRCAPGMRSAMYFPDAKSQSVSWMGCRTSVGALIDDRTRRASSLLLMRRRSRRAPALLLGIVRDGGREAAECVLEELVRAERGLGAPIDDRSPFLGCG